MCKEYGFNFHLLSNGLASDKLIKIVRLFKVKKLFLSLDGRPQTYKMVRGVDGYYNVLKVIEELKDETNITIAYTVNPWNSREDYLHVLEITKKYNLNLETVIYDDVKLFNTEFVGDRLLYDVSNLMDNGLNRKFILFYKKWLEGLRIPCLSIRVNTYVMPNGDVRLCHGTDVVLGNLYERSFDEIWRSRETRKILKLYTNCNKCYGHCHRMFDLGVLEKTKFLPKFILKRLWGDFEYELLFESTGRGK
jgi:MoaA/NifB/PqqE/SkfB family radical SAM enzyme